MMMMIIIMLIILAMSDLTDKVFVFMMDFEPKFSGLPDLNLRN